MSAHVPLTFAGALQELQTRSKSNECWRRALLSVVSTCRSLDEERRVHFAVALANCHLAASQLPVSPCAASMTIAECTKPLAANAMAFNTYTEFYLAIDSMCYSLQREEIQARIEYATGQMLEAGVRSAGALDQVSGQLSQVGASPAAESCVQQVLESDSLRQRTSRSN